MAPSPVLQRFAVILVTAAFAALFGSLLYDTVQADEPSQPTIVQTTLTPILSGPAALVLRALLGCAGGHAASVDRTG